MLVLPSFVVFYEAFMMRSKLGLVNIVLLLTTAFLDFAIGHILHLFIKQLLLFVGLNISKQKKASFFVSLMLFCNNNLLSHKSEWR